MYMTRQYYDQLAILLKLSRILFELPLLPLTNASP